MEKIEGGAQWRRPYLVTRGLRRVLQVFPWHKLPHGQEEGSWTLERVSRTGDVRLHHQETGSVVYLIGMSLRDAGDLVRLLRLCFSREAPPQE